MKSITLGITFALTLHMGIEAQATPLDVKVEKSRPNIVFILADDMGWAQPGFNGGNASLTPNMDQLSKEGMRLSEFYTHSVCAPTRAAFLT
ncbi:MAG: sulfatase-like hydrolase/transferase, partial [Planctomycetota bacterium]|nr:sulfatase-like hydrolase/transferase [Planctomycetota bacterium]